MADLKPVIRNLRLGHLLLPRFLDRWNVRLAGQDDPELYGRMVSWGQDPNAFERLHRRRDVSPGEALHIMDFQKGLYPFLVHMCEQILYDVPLDNRSFRKARIEPEPSFPADRDPQNDTTSSRMTFLYKETYHVPEKPDFRRLQRMVAVKRSQADDKVWGMREDPTMLTSVLQEYKTYAPETSDHVVRCMLYYYLPAVNTWAIIDDKVQDDDDD